MWTGSVHSPKLAEFEQVAAAWRAKSSRENPLAAWSKEGHSVDCSVHPSSTFEENEDSSNSGISSSGSGSRVSVDESVTTSEDDLENNTE